MRLVTALLVKDEADRYLEPVLRRCHEFSDEVLVLDDGSQDGSVEMARRLGCGVKRRDDTGMWGNEAPARAELWDWGARVAGEGWLLIADADMILYGDPRPLTMTTQCTAWAWPLFDCWNDPRFFRMDGYWQGHLHPRPWLFRPSALRETPVWPARGIHTGHMPHNFPLRACPIYDYSVYWMHLAYVRPDDRMKKHRQYLAQAHQLSAFERAHAESVAD